MLNRLRRSQLGAEVWTAVDVVPDERTARQIFRFHLVYLTLVVSAGAHPVEDLSIGHLPKIRVGPMASVPPRLSRMSLEGPGVGTEHCARKGWD